MQIGQFRLQRVVCRAGTADVARAPGAGAHLAGRRAGGLDHDGMAAHTEIVVGRPDQHLAAIRAPVQREPFCLLAQRREAAVAALRLDAGQGLAAMGVERVHPSHDPFGMDDSLSRTAVVCHASNS